MSTVTHVLVPVTFQPLSQQVAVAALEKSKSQAFPNFRGPVDWLNCYHVRRRSWGDTLNIFVCQHIFSLLLDLH